MSTNGSTSWRMVGDEVGSCNCDWGCPCQFDALPTHGNCMAMIAYEVTRGKLRRHAPRRACASPSWSRGPGPIHEGGGTRQTIIDESASPEQREAIEALVLGKHGGDYFEIFASVMSKELDTVYAPIEIDADREARTASVRIGDLAERHGRADQEPGDGRRAPGADRPAGWVRVQAGGDREHGAARASRRRSRCPSRSRTPTRS